jgi:hypothetical protein
MIKSHSEQIHKKSDGKFLAEIRRKHAEIRRMLFQRLSAKFQRISAREKYIAEIRDISAYDKIT